MLKEVTLTSLTYLVTYSIGGEVFEQVSHFVPSQKAMDETLEHLAESFEKVSAEFIGYHTETKLVPIDSLAYVLANK